MSRFAKIDEQVLLRHKELTGENGKPAKETLFLYLLIVFHSFDGGICKKSLKELCEIYDLDYDNSTRRTKTLREKGWIENTKKHLRPLIINFPKDAKQTVDSTVEYQTKTVNSTVLKDEKTVRFTAENCKSYSESDEKTVKFTVENAETSTTASDYDGFKTFKDLKTFETLTAADPKPAAAAVKINGHLSIFSIEECLRYAAICAQNGEPIKSVEALAKHAHKTGEMDAFISAALHPEQPAQVIGSAAVAPESRLDEALSVLIDLSADGIDLSGQKAFYSPGDWAWLMEQLEVYE